MRQMSKVTSEQPLPADAYSRLAPTAKNRAKALKLAYLLSQSLPEYSAFETCFVHVIKSLG